MTCLEVNPGTCGLIAVIRAQSDDEGRVQIEVESECSAVKRLAGCLKVIDPCAEGGTIFESSIYKTADTCLKHPECIVPAAMIRAANVEAGLALPKEAWIRLIEE